MILPAQQKFPYDKSKEKKGGSTVVIQGTYSQFGYFTAVAFSGQLSERLFGICVTGKKNITVGFKKTFLYWNAS